jgi:hypothetical protein
MSADRSAELGRSAGCRGVKGGNNPLTHQAGAPLADGGSFSGTSLGVMVANDDICVFLSSTAQDLRPERAAVLKTLHRMRVRSEAMEYFGANDRCPREVVETKLRTCSVYIGIIGFRYGSLLPNSTRSFTEHEYDIASQIGIPRLVYLRSKKSRVKLDDVDVSSDSIERLSRFKARVNEAHVVSEFRDPAQLAASIAADLYGLLRNRQERSQIVDQASPLQVPRVLIKRAEMAALAAQAMIAERYAEEQRGEISREQAQRLAFDFFAKYSFRFDGEFHISDSHGITIYHQWDHMIGETFAWGKDGFFPLIDVSDSGKRGGLLKWVDTLSSDYLVKGSAFYTDRQDTRWIRFNVAPYFFFQPWGWCVLVEAHNEIHDLRQETLEDTLDEFRKKGWAVVP